MNRAGNAANRQRPVNPRVEELRGRGGPVLPFEYEFVRQTSPFDRPRLQDKVSDVFTRLMPQSLAKHAGQRQQLHAAYEQGSVPIEEIMRRTSAATGYQQQEVCGALNGLQDTSARLLYEYKTSMHPGLQRAVDDLNAVFDGAEPGNFSHEEVTRVAEVMNRADLYGASQFNGIYANRQEDERLRQLLFGAFVGRGYAALEQNMYGSNFADRDDVEPTLQGYVEAFGMPKHDAETAYAFLDSGFDAIRFELGAEAAQI